MNIVIPMAGRGQRFVDAGYDTPKPLIDVHGRPMYSWAVDSLPLELATRLVFVCLEEHLRASDLAEDIERRYVNHEPVVLSVPEVTGGQACTVLEAYPSLDPDASLLIYNADTISRPGLAGILSQPGSTPDGILGVFHADGRHWSFARTDDEDRVVETAEKSRISPWASTGLYWFARVDLFVDPCRAMMENDETSVGEYYVAPIYNRLIEAGGDVRIDLAEDVHVIGTPDELQAFLSLEG